MQKSVDQAVSVAEKLKSDVHVVKAQIYAGGRGKAGGVKIARSLDEVEKHAESILFKKLVTHQTGSEGIEVKTLFIEEGCQIDREFYLGLLLDRVYGKLVFIGSSEGGVDIEKVAEENPDKIIKVVVEPSKGYSPYIGRKMAYSMGIDDKKIVNQIIKFMEGIYKLYVDKDCSIVEINPMTITTSGDVIALDAKINFDSNALFRQQDIVEIHELEEGSEKEVEANKYGLSYISLDGNIGCLVNGAGLAMATMDIIKQAGGEPANFLDVGGSATKEAVQKAFSIILSDEKVKGILVNIFGGIMKCDIIAEGIVAAAKDLAISVPLVVRLEGTNVAVGKKILEDSGLKIVFVRDLGEAAVKIVEEIN